MAQRLAAEGGLDVEAARILEQQWKSNAMRKHESSATPFEPEVQVIDLVSEDTVRVGGEFQVTALEMTENNVDLIPFVESSDPGAEADTKVRSEIHEPCRPKLATSKPTKTLGAKAGLKPIDISSYPDLTIDPLSLPVLRCPWDNYNVTAETPPTPYSFLSHTLCSLSQTRSRIAITNILTNALRFIIHHGEKLE